MAGSWSVEPISSCSPLAAGISICIRARRVLRRIDLSIPVKRCLRQMSKAVKSEKTEEKVLAKLREICSALPEVQEVKTWGHPTFKAGTKTFAVLETYNGHLCICFKATLPLQQLLIEDPRYFKTPYIGKQGWVSLIADTPPKWGEVRQLIKESYQLVTGKKKQI